MQQHWQGYLQSLGAQGIPKSSTAEPATGFQPLAVAQPNVQAKYDAMSGSWEGIQASESAVSSGLFKTSSMPYTKWPKQEK
jgi:hypothetical protein